MKIIQILNQGKTIYGLGDDGKLYRFSYSAKEWVLAEIVED